MTVTAPPTDRRLSDFLEGAQFSVCPIICGSNGLTAKRKRSGLRMKCQYPTSSVSRPSLSSDFPSVACFRCRMPFCVWLAAARFSDRIRSAGGRFCPKRFYRLTLPLPSEPCAIFASVHREVAAGGMSLNYTIGYYLCHWKQTM